jgi:hypothetical protein
MRNNEKGRILIEAIPRSTDEMSGYQEIEQPRSPSKAERAG